LFSAEELLLVRGQRVALLGANGSGKTTLLRTMFGQVAPLAGTIEIGPSVNVAYFAQAHDMLDLDNRLMAEFLRHNPGMKDETARHLLSKYQFKGDDLDKIVRGLSGGERARLALAILAQHKPNLLVLDEPTNHLDIYALEVLEEVLSGYDGSMLLVSHDRHLVGKLASDVWHIENRRLHSFNGTYDEWITERQRRAPAAPVPPRPTALLKASASAPSAQARSKNAQAQLARALQKAEERVAACEREIKRIAALLDAGPPTEKAVALSAEYARAEADLEKALAEWEALHGEGDDEQQR
jgi:ATP-binding cassette subfamily F protein 3